MSYYADDQIALHHGDALEVARELPAGAAELSLNTRLTNAVLDFATAAVANAAETPTPAENRP